MTSDQQAVARQALQQAVDMAIGRLLWSIDPAIAAAVGMAAFGLLWWLVS